MYYPIDEEQVVAKWLAVLDKPDEADRELLTSIAKGVNQAYLAGKEDKEVAK